MSEISPALLEDIRGKFAHVDSCPQQGPRVFFENAGGALTLNSVVRCSHHYAAIPDNQGRDNAGSHELVRVIAKAKKDMGDFMNAPDGSFFMGESGTELLFRLIMNACLGRVATILHTSPVTGMAVDVAAISAVIRKVAPACFIIVDGIQHAAHGGIDIASYDVDGYVISPYKMFSRHGYGLAWISDRLRSLPHDMLVGGPKDNWELGTRDTGAYATLSEVVRYFEWLGSQVTDETDRRAKFIAAGQAIHAHETALTDAMINGTGNLPGLAEMAGVHIIGGADNPAREGLVALYIDTVASVDVVSALNAQGIRTHLRKADHYSGNILDPLGLDGCVRVSMCHYNSRQEIAQFLTAMKQIADPDAGRGA